MANRQFSTPSAFDVFSEAFVLFKNNYIAWLTLFFLMLTIAVILALPQMYINYNSWSDSSGISYSHSYFLLHILTSPIGLLVYFFFHMLWPFFYVWMAMVLSGFVLDPEKDIPTLVKDVDNKIFSCLLVAAISYVAVIGGNAFFIGIGIMLSILFVAFNYTTVDKDVTIRQAIQESLNYLRLQRLFGKFGTYPLLSSKESVKNVWLSWVLKYLSFFLILLFLGFMLFTAKSMIMLPFGSFFNSNPFIYFMLFGGLYGFVYPVIFFIIYFLELIWVGVFYQTIKVIQSSEEDVPETVTVTTVINDKPNILDTINADTASSIIVAILFLLFSFIIVVPTSSTLRELLETRVYTFLNWNHYENVAEGYRVSHPASWSVDAPEDEDSVTIANVDTSEGKWGVVMKITPLSQAAQAESAKLRGQMLSPMKVNNREILRYRADYPFLDNGSLYQLFYLIKDGNKMYEVSFTTTDEKLRDDGRLFDQVMQSFRFVK